MLIQFNTIALICCRQGSKISTNYRWDFSSEITNDKVSFKGFEKARNFTKSFENRGLHTVTVTAKNSQGSAKTSLTFMVEGERVICQRHPLSLWDISPQFTARKQAWPFWAKAKISFASWRGHFRYFCVFFKEIVRHQADACLIPACHPFETWTVSFIVHSLVSFRSLEETLRHLRHFCLALVPQEITSYVQTLGLRDDGTNTETTRHAQVCGNNWIRRIVGVKRKMEELVVGVGVKESFI